MKKSSSTKDQTKNIEIIIIGIGFGGLYTYKHLRRHKKSNIKLTLFDKNNYFLFTPLLHEVATGNLSHEQVITPIHTFVKQNDRFIHTKVDSISLKDNYVVYHDDIKKSYDYLVISTGSASTNKVPGLEDYSYPLKSLQDSMKIKSKLIELYNTKSTNKITINVLGAGPTGIELTSEIREYTKLLMEHYKEKTTIINLITHDDSILSRLSSTTQKKVRSRLESMDINLLTNSKVEKVTESQVYIKDKVISSNLTINSLGVLPTFPELDDKSVIQNNKFRVNSSLNLQNYPNVFVLGDIVEGLPMDAQAATQEGKVVGQNIIKSIQNKPLKSFKYNNRGFLISMGKKYAVGQIKNKTISGTHVWFLWRTVYLTKMVNFWKKIQVATNWTTNIFLKRDTTKIN